MELLKQIIHNDFIFVCSVFYTAIYGVAFGFNNTVQHFKAMFNKNLILIGQNTTGKFLDVIFWFTCLHIFYLYI